MERESRQDHWLGRYANDYHAWRRAQHRGRDVFQRPLGLIETSFDNDGAFFGGRADVNTVISFEVRSNLTPEQLRERIVLAWANLRLHHILLMTTVTRDSVTDRRLFNLDLPTTNTEVVENALASMAFLADHYSEVDIDDWFKHINNSSRVVDSDRSLSRLFVHPVVPISQHTFQLTFTLVCAHEICDGVVVLYNWEPHFLELLNSSEQDLKRGLEVERSPDRLWTRLPRAQEDLYPLVQGSPARKRWFWAVMRILRHVRRPPPAGFANPLRRRDRREQAMSLPPKYSDVLDYSEDRKPPMNSFNVKAELSREATSRIERLAKSVGASVGAACFALVGMAMMEIEEARDPHTLLSERMPYVGSFPINPRPFFGYTGPADSVMLTFSDGIWLPFLPSDLPAEGRFKLLVRQAHRQLRQYQKRIRSEGMKGSFDPTDPARIIASSYILAVERAEFLRPQHLKTGVNPQGDYPANFKWRPATCGVSSIGSIKNFLARGKYSLDEDTVRKNGLAADLYSFDRTGVRARDFEFLCGCWGSEDGLKFSVSYDGNAIDEESVLVWKALMEGMFEPSAKSKL
ncbi:hypothetical protein BFW01_g4308 [Lasiodiplodia theobromae]|uniref:Condensation domain-containing protein n=1 Tax=Lasiodiplodia theobromae TaxID=45133 RepID=A0A5N5D1L5_9PEZI|nr:uncharacterized protein LTHEOB_10898 [Lasiodiplodia theobromae]KAB2571312.1 hypothetical protein DBV05_g9984 [Lasiodiplodia theobromae]KAF4538331.1 hypothetical protein LTHEOB_10898 [Lasiodiplodia theobromae]KAF9633414.1 hypothetical protein BFW01_g4308 [Lasiodiplodia theobromae]